MTRAGVMSVVTKRAFIGMMLFAWMPFVVRAVQIYVSQTFTQATFLAPKGETFREFLDQQGTFVFFVTIYVGAGLIANDRRANALAAVSLETDDERRIHCRQARHPVRVPGLGDVPAGDDAAPDAGNFRRQPDLHRATISTCCPRSRCSR